MCHDETYTGGTEMQNDRERGNAEPMKTLSGHKRLRSTSRLQRFFAGCSTWVLAQHTALPYH